MIKNSLDDDSFVTDYNVNDAKQIPFKSSNKNETSNYADHRELDIFSEGFSVMDELRKDEKLCDVVLRVEDKSFVCHRIVLASTIPYFKSMFTLDVIESKQKEIIIRDFDAGALELLIDFAYTGRVIIHVNNVRSLMFGASFLQLGRLKDACINFLKERFSPSNVLGIRLFADNLKDCATLVDSADKYIRRYFHLVSMSDEFHLISGNDLMKIIERNELDVDTEEQVFEAVMQWIRQDQENRKTMLPQLLAHVRLPLLSTSYLVDKVSTDPLIKASHECRDLVDEARDFHLMPERRELVPYFKSQKRYAIGHLFAVGGLTTSGESQSTVEVYNPETKLWNKAEAMSMLRSRVGVAVMNNKLYAVGGYNGSERLSTAEVFDPVDRAWRRVSPMHFNRSAVGTAALNNRLYVCGGYNGCISLNTVECYIPERDEWNITTSMQKQRSAGGVIAFRDHIYALGGHDGLSIFDLVEKFSPTTGIWTSVTSMQSKRCRLGVAVLNDKLYACGGYDGATFLQTVEVYDHETDRWKYVAPMKVMRSRVALVSNMGKLWAIGGYDGVSNLSSVEVYDPRVDQWYFVEPMCAHAGGVGAGVIIPCP